MKNKKVLLYSLGAISLAAIGYYAITSKSKSPTPKSNNQSIDENSTITTSTGEEITVAQATVPTSLASILALPLDQSTKILKGKHLQNKITNVNVRYSAKVNNGIINNITGKIITPSLNLGTIISVVNDENGLKNQNGKVYKWVKFILSPEGKLEINKNKDFFAANLLENINYTVYLREDTLTI